MGYTVVRSQVGLLLKMQMRKRQSSMTLGRCFCFAILLLLFAFPLSAAEVVVEFLDGFLEFQEDEAWLEADIGDTLPADCTIRLGEESFVELADERGKITISAPGIYNLSELLKSRSEKQKRLGGFLKQALTRVVEEPEATESVSMGVRAAEVEDEPFQWMDEEEEIVAQGKDLLAEGLYQEALIFFQDAIEDWGLTEEGALAFYLGVTYAMLGENAKALRRLSVLEPDPWEDYYADWAVLTGQLYMDSLAYQRALEVFKGYLSEYPPDETAQLVLYLSGLCHRELGNEEVAEESFRQAYQILPESDVGKRIADELDVR
jgi:tetratricopeptide (TPR) repeat protein